MSKDSTSNDLLIGKEVTDEEAQKFSLDAHLIRVMLDEPFYAGVLRGVSYTKTESIPTAGVLAKDGDVHMWWNPKFLAGLTADQVKGLIKHEAMHLALEHTTSRRMTPHIIHNYATDLAINSDIPKKELPEGGLIPGEQFAELTAEQAENMGPDAVARYYRVSEKIASFPKGESSEWYFTKLMEDPEVSKDIQEGNDGEGSGLPGGMDDHDGWGEMSEEDKELLKGKIAKAVEDAVKECDRSGRWLSLIHI